MSVDSVRARFADGFGFEARVFETDGAAVVAVVGEIDMATVGLFRQAIDDACSCSQHVVIDLADTTFIDSSGLAVVVRAHGVLGRAPGAVVVRASGAPVTRTFEVSGLGHLIAW
jgi:stage II sporulation protein AA (anti-sigma F factor antagonist)